MREYQHHIADTHEERKGKAICGAQLSGWSYVSVDHAFLSAPRDHMQPCPDCAKAVADVFTKCE